jgi:hypothetical protein
LPSRKKNPQEWATLMRHMGVSEDLIETQLVDLRWPAFQEFVQRLQEQGKPMPPSVDPSRSYTEYKLRLRKSNDSLETTYDWEE